MDDVQQPARARKRTWEVDNSLELPVWNNAPRLIPPQYRPDTDPICRPETSAQVGYES